jgi:trimethylamine--corrinoid protein Co-methyltransferase
MASLAGADWVTGLGLVQTYTRLYPESLLLDLDIYQKARYYLMEMEVSPETLALDTIQAVGPGGHFLGQKHTRKHMREAMVRGVSHQIGPDGKYRDPHEYAIDRVKWILANHQPQPLDEKKGSELDRILASADKELG